MAEDFVDKIDLDGEQWDLQDTKAQGDINELIAKIVGIEDYTLGGTTTFSAKRKYIGEDTNYEYYIFWFEAQERNLGSGLTLISILPNDTSKEKIISLTLNPLQDGNPLLYLRTQHATGANSSGLLTYLGGVQSGANWTFSGDGILRVAK